MYHTTKHYQKPVDKCSKEIMWYIFGRGCTTLWRKWCHG